MSVASPSCSSSDTASQPGNFRDDDGWQDVGSDQDSVDVVSFFGDQTFDGLAEMLEDCRLNHGFDFVAAQKRLGLDFYETVKFVNYIRSGVKSGLGSGHFNSISSKDQFGDEKYLQSVLEDDAVLFCIGDLDCEDDETTTGDIVTTGDGNRVAELEAQLRKLQSEYSDYRSTVAETLDRRWGADDEDANKSKSGPTAESQKKIDSSYFDSYSYNEIHETMLKDTVRTEAYRDFIYQNKHLFAGKTVLDVGCGTGILSMFCAKAGAAMVIAVDNSGIISKARENIFSNKLDQIITCVAGKIEEVDLPAEKVDIIVSEWMGYCLTFEAMLDSVIWARDKYLAPDGLMVPSHCTLVAAPITDSDYITDSVDYWKDVYGFDMSAMKQKMHDDVLIRHLDADVVIGSTIPFLTLPLHTVKVSDLTFTRPFSSRIRTDSERLDGFVIWFDTFFLPSRQSELPEEANATITSGLPSGSIAFTTGPHGQETHWRSGVLMIEREGTKQQLVELKKDQHMQGSIKFDRATTNDRGLDITVTWDVADSAEKGQQSWTLD